MPLDPTHIRPVREEEADKIGVPGTGVVLAVMLTAACFAIGWIAFEAFAVLRRWFA